MFKLLLQLNKSEKENNVAKSKCQLSLPRKTQTNAFHFHARGMTLVQQSICIPANDKHAL